MSVADKVGASSSFGRRSARGRAKAVTEGAIPGYELARLPLDRVVPTPLNPRRNFGSDEELTRFGEELRDVQLAACVAVTREAYLKLWPSHAEAIGPDCAYVLVNGERRLRSALHVGLDKLDFVVRDELAATREDFVDHLLAENLDREDFDVIERARGVDELVRVCAENGGERGARSRAAARLGKDRSWVTNQLALLTLPVEIQAMLSSGEVSERDGRALARVLKDHPEQDADQLLAYLADAKESAQRQKEEDKRLLDAGRAASAQSVPSSLLSADNKPSNPTEPTTPSSEGQPAVGGSLSADNELRGGDVPSHSADVEALPSAASLSADNKPSNPTEPAAPFSEGEPAVGGSLSADNNSADAPDTDIELISRQQESDGVPVPRGEQLPGTARRPMATGLKFPYDDAGQAARFLSARMDDTQFFKLVDLLSELAGRRRASLQPADE